MVNVGLEAFPQILEEELKRLKVGQKTSITLI